MSESGELRPALGNYAAGDRFWDRQREVTDIRAYLDDGQSVLVTGPRRVGKTSVVHRVLDELQPGTRVAFVDVEHQSDPAELFAAVAAARRGDAAFWRRLIGWFGARLGQATARLESVDLLGLKIELQAAMAGSWRADAWAILSALAESEGPYRGRRRRAPAPGRSHPAT